MFGDISSEAAHGRRDVGIVVETYEHIALLEKSTAFPLRAEVAGLRTTSGTEAHVVARTAVKRRPARKTFAAICTRPIISGDIPPLTLRILFVRH